MVTLPYSQSSFVRPALNTWSSLVSEKSPHGDNLAYNFVLSTLTSEIQNERGVNVQETEEVKGVGLGLLGRETEVQGEEICPQSFLSQSFDPPPHLSKLPPSTPVGVDQGMYVCNILLHKTKTKNKWRNEIVKYHLLIKNQKNRNHGHSSFLCLSSLNLGKL